jgi:hypothetical protein
VCARQSFELRALNPFAPLWYLSRKFTALSKSYGILPYLALSQPSGADSRLLRSIIIVIIPTTLCGAGMMDYLFYYLQSYMHYMVMDNAWQCDD